MVIAEWSPVLRERERESERERERERVLINRDKKKVKMITLHVEMLKTKALYLHYIKPALSLTSLSVGNKAIHLLIICVIQCNSIQVMKKPHRSFMDNRPIAFSHSDWWLTAGLSAGKWLEHFVWLFLSTYTSKWLKPACTPLTLHI